LIAGINLDIEEQFYRFVRLPMSLKEYNTKRDFKKTPEPDGLKKADMPSRTDKEALRFVIQKHDASKLHYDFRLETRDGVLLSWAVPKGPSLDPGQRRLAIETEDHPLDYIDFEGIIPEGNYGAGTVIVWDTGTYTTEGDIRDQFREGKISFVLKGRKIKGAFMLIKIKGRHRQWLLIKIDDSFAAPESDLTRTAPESVITGRTNDELSSKRVRKQPNADGSFDTTDLEKAQFPLSIRPMLAQDGDEPFDKEGWVFEVKWDGVRGILLRNKAKGITEIQSRNGKNISHRYPEILKAIDSVIKINGSIVLDGEIVVLNSEGIPDFQLHQRRMHVESQLDIGFLSNNTPATYFVFDILYNDGKSIEGLDFIDRRRILDSVIAKGSKRICISEYIEEKGRALFNSVVERKLEGIVAKYKHSKYRQGIRSPAWLKIKRFLTQDCVVIGYTKGEGNRQDYFGSLILAIYEKDKLRFVGHSGSGFGREQLAETLRLMQRLKIDKCPLQLVPYTNSPPVWLKPKLVAEVRFSGWTQDMIMRAPIFLRFRYDKMPTECMIEHIERQQNARDMAGTSIATTTSASVGNNHKQKHIPPTQNFSNLDKIFWGARGKQKQLTKGDLIEYYDKISKYILPHLQNRPLSLKRYPDGIAGKSFFHKNWMHQLFSQARNDIINYLICNNKETLLWLANLGCIEMHPWYSTVHDFSACINANTCLDPLPLDEEKCGLDTPDFIVFDLDPYVYSGKEKEGEEPEYNVKGFKATIDIALDLKDLLNELNINSYVKTSGKTGLHVFVPVAPIYTYVQTRSFAEIIGRMLSRRVPDKITMDWNSSNRKGKVFFDYNQNAKGKTIASIFSVRPTASASVSMPIKWKQLLNIQPSDFTLINVPNILAVTGDPWSDIFENRQDLLKMIQRAS
jgi:bifunctional non-homologous end joining protein LigD